MPSNKSYTKFTVVSEEVEEINDIDDILVSFLNMKGGYLSVKSKDIRYQG